MNADQTKQATALVMTQYKGKIYYPIEVYRYCRLCPEPPFGFVIASSQSRGSACDWCTVANPSSSYA